MHAVSIYKILVKGELEEDTINTVSPIQIAVEKTSIAGTQLKTQTDQSGLVGLVRFFHKQGLIILSVKREINN